LSFQKFKGGFLAVELLDFYADWCGPCKVMEPVIEELERELAGKITIKKIDVDQEADVASNYGVMSIPTYLIVKDGQEIERFIGAQPKDEILKKIQSHVS
jgi:thioredoxin 1